MEGDLGDVETGMFAETGALLRLFSFLREARFSGRITRSAGINPRAERVFHLPAGR